MNAISLFSLSLPISERNDMTKKTLMHITLILNITMIITYAFLSFASINQTQMYDGKRALTVTKPSEMTNSVFIQSILQSAFSLKSDIMYCRVNQNYDYQYYKTNIREDFVDIPTNLGSAMIEEGKYISTRDGAYGKIYGFVITGSHIEIHNISDLKKIDVDLSDGTFYIDEEQANSWISNFNQMGATCSEQNGAWMEGAYSGLIVVLILFVFFLFISVVFYAFSKARDFTIKKSMGYSNVNISLGELKNNMMQSTLEFALLIVCVVITLSFLYDYVSSFLFLAKMLPLIVLLFLFLQIVFFASVFIVSARCKVQHIKGYNRDMALFRVTTIFKVVVFLSLIAYMSTISDSFLTAYKQYSVTKEIAEKVDGYALTTLSGMSGDPSSNPDKYVNRMLLFYREMIDTKQAIVADMQTASYIYSEEDRGGDLPYVNVNGNYLDFNDTIFDKSGNRITSGNLLSGKYNILVPEGYDTEKILQLPIVINSFGKEKMNFIEYSAESKFFTFSKNVFTDNPGYCKDVVVWIYDPDLEAETMSSLFVTEGIAAYISRCLYFPYDTDSNQTPYEQILEIIDETNMSNIIGSAPTVKDSFMKELSAMRDQLIILSILLAVLVFSFLYLLVYATELYFLNHAKDISVKLMHGHSLLDICTGRLLLKAAILPVISVLGLFTEISMPLAYLAVFGELVIFFLVMKKQTHENVISTIKGQI